MKTPLRFAILRFSWCGRTCTSREAGELCEMEEFGCRAFENKSVSRILSPEIRARFRGGDHSSRPAVAGRLKRPTRRRSAPDGRDFGRAALSDDLPIWSCTARSLPGRACHHARRCALTLSPVGPHRFTHHPLPRSRRREARWLVCSLLHLSSPGESRTALAVPLRLAPSR